MWVRLSTLLWETKAGFGFLDPSKLPSWQPRHTHAHIHTHARHASSGEEHMRQIFGEENHILKPVADTPHVLAAT